MIQFPLSDLYIYRSSKFKVFISLVFPVHNRPSLSLLLSAFLIKNYQMSLEGSTWVHGVFLILFGFFNFLVVHAYLRAWYTENRKESNNLEKPLARTRLELYRNDIQSLWDDVHGKYMLLFNFFAGDYRNEALTVLREVLWLYQQINISSRDMKIMDDGSEFKIC